MIKKHRDGRYYIRVRLYPNYQKSRTIPDADWPKTQPVNRKVAQEEEKRLSLQLDAERIADRSNAQRKNSSECSLKIKSYRTFADLINLYLQESGFSGIPESIWNQIIKNHGHVPVDAESLADAYKERVKFLSIPYNPSRSKNPLVVEKAIPKKYSVRTVNANKQVFAFVFNRARDRGLLNLIPCEISYDTPNARDRVRTAEEKDRFDRALLLTDSYIRVAVWIMERNKIRPEQIFDLPKTAYDCDSDRIIITHTKTGVRSVYIEIPHWFASYVRILPQDCPWLFPHLYDDGTWSKMGNIKNHFKRICRMAGVHDFTMKDLNHEAETFMLDKQYTKLEMDNLGQSMTKRVEQIYYHRDHLKVQRRPDIETGTILKFERKAV